MAHALGIAVSRAAGLSANSAATELGLTHFGWAAAHGLEAAWLARDGMKASLDIGQALGVFYPSAAVSVADLGADALMGLRRTYFKHFPCNVYLNLIVLALAEGEAREADTLAVELPAVRHLDVPAPTSVRQARNSAQAVAAASARGAPTYRTFSAPELDLATNAPLAELARRVTVSMPPDRPTDLGRASVRVHAVRGRHVLLDHTVHATALAPYGRAHAEHLVSGLGLDDWVTTLYGAEYRRAADLAFDRVLSTAQVEV
jgi:2-methylcitrate dehydratase PrpD